MKTSLFKNWIYGVLAVGALIASFTQPAHAGREGNGGGGIVRHGRYLTFGSANVFVRPVPTQEIPGLSDLLETVTRMPLLKKLKSRLLRSIQPDGERQYFNISEDDLTEENLSSLKAEYKNIFKEKIPEEDLVIYAITRGKETYILPSFHLLNRVEQQTILFHESLWIVNPKLSYESVVDSEIRFQQYLHSGGHGFDLALMESLEEIFDDSSVTLTSAAIDDLTYGRLRAFQDRSGRISFQTLFGSNSHFYVTQNKSAADHSSKSNYTYSFSDIASPIEHLDKMIRKYPGIQTFRVLRTQIHRIALFSRNSVTVYPDGRLPRRTGPLREYSVQGSSVPWQPQDIQAFQVSFDLTKGPRQFRGQCRQNPGKTYIEARLAGKCQLPFSCHPEDFVIRRTYSADTFCKATPIGFAMLPRKQAQ